MEIWMKFTKRKFIQWFIIYYIAAFAMCFSIMEADSIFGLGGAKEVLSESDELLERDFCSHISKVSASGEVITVEFVPKYSINVNESLKHFSLATSWLKQDIFFPPGSGNITAVRGSALDVVFYLPVVDNYSATFQCSNSPKSVRSSSEVSPIMSTQILLQTETFSADYEYSRLDCHGSDFLTRWCEAKNLPYFDDNFFFLSPAIFSFPEPFLVPGPRAPPFDKELDRLVSEPIVIQFTKTNVPRSLEVVNKITYIYGTFHNYYMLWHTMFDFILPFYRFTHTVNRTDTPDDRRIYVKSDGVWMFFSLIKAISTEPIRIIDQEKSGLLMPNAVMGIIKFEANISASRTYEDSIAFQYNYDGDSVAGFRNDILNAMKISTTNVGEDHKPLVVIIDRGMTKRNIQNQNEITKFITETCEFCKIRSLRLEQVGVDQQVEIISRASVLIGLHGSGLANVLWMNESSVNHPTHLIEFLPYNYSCRPWYNTAANTARVNYHSVMNKEPDWSRSSNLGNCWRNSKLCATVYCHDLLRDQPFNVEMNTFNEVWAPIVKQLKTTIPVP